MKQMLVNERSIDADPVSPSTPATPTPPALNPVTSTQKSVVPPASTVPVLPMTATTPTNGSVGFPMPSTATLSPLEEPVKAPAAPASRNGAVPTVTPTSGWDCDDARQRSR